MRKHNFYFYLFITLASAFIVRLYLSNILLSSDISIAFPLPYTDMATYKKLAIEISRNICPSNYYYQPFYYAVFLSNIFIYLGTDINYVIIVQSLLGVMTVLFSALSAELLWDKKATLVTAILVTFSHILIFYTPYMLIVTLQAFWVSLILYLAILAFKKHNLWIYLLLGLCMGCSILTRGNMWIMLPMFIWLSLYSGIQKYKISDKVFRKKVFSETLDTKPERHRNAKGLIFSASCKSKSIILLPMIILILFILLPQTPFIIKNSIYTGRLCGPSTAGTAVFVLGNTPDSPPGGLHYSQIYENWMANGKTACLNNFYNHVKNNKLSYLDNLINKLILFWDHREIPNNANINLATGNNLSFSLIGFATTPFIIIFALSGIFIFLPTRKNKLIYLIPFLFVISYWVSISLFYILARFRAPLIPVLSVYAGGFINYLLFSKSSSISRRIMFSVFLLLFSVYITYVLYNVYYLKFEPYISKIIRPCGTVTKINNSLAIKDNAPPMYQSRYLLHLKKNDNIIKEFLIPAPAKTITSGKLELIVFALKPSLLILNVNGINNKFFLKKGYQPVLLKSPMKLMPEKRNTTAVKFNIKVIDTNRLQYLILDHQRNYNRTIINNKPAPSELVAKLTIF